jgi:hypothetical protein
MIANSVVFPGSPLFDLVAIIVLASGLYLWLSRRSRKPNRSRAMRAHPPRRLSSPPGNSKFINGGGVEAGHDCNFRDICFSDGPCRDQFY